MTEVDQAARPAPPGAAKPGMKWEAQPAPASGAGVPHPSMTCRYKLGVKDKACGRAAVLFIWRGVRSRVRWHYCGEHAAVYGYWREGARIMRWAQVPERQET